MNNSESFRRNTVIVTEEDLQSNMYRVNFMGFPYNLFALFNFGRELVRQVWDTTMECSLIDLILKFRYVLVVGYFAVRIFSPHYTFNSSYSEIPLILALLMDLCNLIRNFEVAAMIRFGFLVVIVIGSLLLRKRSTWKILLNTWKEDGGDIEDDGKFSINKKKFLV